MLAMFIGSDHMKLLPNAWNAKPKKFMNCNDMKKVRWESYFYVILIPLKSFSGWSYHKECRNDVASRAKTKCATAESSQADARIGCILAWEFGNQSSWNRGCCYSHSFALKWHTTSWSFRKIFSSRRFLHSFLLFTYLLFQQNFLFTLWQQLSLAQIFQSVLSV